jgi:ribosomal protein L12E/L44/L45/RPP1/RPP2
LAEEMLDVTLNVVDGNGTPIREIPLGRQSRGNVQTTWDGYLESGFPAETGRYSFTIKGVNMQGKEVNVDTKTEGRVTGVTSAQGKVFLLVGEQKIALDDVQSINEAKEDDKKKTAPAAPASTPQQAIAQVAEKTSEDDKKTSGTENETPRVESRIDDKKLNDLLPLLYR